MGFMKRRRQPALYRDPSIDPTPEIARRLAHDKVNNEAAANLAAARPVHVDQHMRRKPKSAKKKAAR